MIESNVSLCSLPKNDNESIYRRNIHVLYGLCVALRHLNFTYVVITEGDTSVSKDFFEYHNHLSEYSADHPQVIAVTAFPEGPHHDCFWVADKLQGSGIFPANDPAVLFSNGYFTGSGSGMTRKALSLLLSMNVKDFSSMEYDELLRIAVIDGANQGFVLSPCKPRIKYLPASNQSGPPRDEIPSPPWDSTLDLEADESRVLVYRVLFPPAGGAAGSAAGGGNWDVQHLITQQMLPSEQEVADHLQLAQMPHSAHRCVGVDWKSRSCHFKHVCFDPFSAEGPLAGGEFLYFADPSLGHVYDAVPMSVALNSGATAGPERYGPQWAPRVVEGRIPGDVALERGGPHVLLTEYNFANPMLLVADYHLPWFLLLGLFGLDDDPSPSVALRASLKLPLDSSCQYMHRDLCDRMTALFFPAGRPSLLSDRPFRDLDSERERTGEGGQVCFESLLAGTGRLTDHCSDEYLHGLEASGAAAANTYCNVGRASSLRRFRRHVLARLRLPEPPRPARRLVAIGNFTVGEDPAGFLARLPLVGSLLRGRGVDSAAADFPALPLRGQAAAVCGASAYLGI